VAVMCLRRHRRQRLGRTVGWLMPELKARQLDKSPFGGKDAPRKTRAVALAETEPSWPRSNLPAYRRRPSGRPVSGRAAKKPWTNEIER